MTSWGVHQNIATSEGLREAKGRGFLALVLLAYFAASPSASFLANP